MNDFTSYFIGIPLPEKYQQSFEDILKEISQIDPVFQPTFSKTPHITVCYLDKKIQTSLPKIAKNVSSYLKIVKGVKLTVGCFGYFRKNDPKVLFLDVKYPKTLLEFNEVIIKSLSTSSATDNNLPFYPHVTLAKLGDSENKKIFKAHKIYLRTLLDEVNWSFEITEVDIYGVDSTKQPEYQEKLIFL